jgi:Rhs element Vgr protein
MASLISRHALSGDAASTPDQLEEITQFAASDWDFLLSRAEANGMVVQVRDAKVTVAAPETSASPVLGVTYGIDMIEVSLEEDARSQLSSVACTSWDPAAQALVTTSELVGNDNPLGGDSSSDLSKVAATEAYALTTTAPIDAAALKTWAGAQLIKSSLAKIRGTVRFQGSAAIGPGQTLGLSGLGERFDGNAYVSGVTQELRDGNWTTLVSVGLDPAWFAARADVSAPPANALLPGVRGLQVGTVVQIHADPAGQFRVLVKVPTVDDTGKAIWARLSRPYATSNAGFFFYPEVGDEVALAFLDADPRFPVIVGSLFSSSRPPPLTPDEKNTQKAIVTNSQLKVLFDEEKKVITLVTPAGNTIVISDEDKAITLTDQNTNSVKLSADGITLTSASDIVIKAAQNITLEAQAGKLTAKGTQGVSVSGLTVALSADTEFSAAGNATASLTSSGEAKVQGAIVMIN